MSDGEVVYSSRHILDQDAHLREKEKETMKRVRDWIEEQAEGLK